VITIYNVFRVALWVAYKRGTCVHTCA